MPYRVPRWIPALAHLSQRVSSKFSSDSGAPQISDSRRDPSKGHRRTRLTSWFSGVNLDDPNPNPGGRQYLRRRPAVSRPQRHSVQPEEATYLHSRDKKAARPLYTRSNDNHITNPHIPNPRPSQRASYHPSGSPGPSSVNNRSGALTSGAQQVTAKVMSGFLGEPTNRRDLIATIPTIVITPPLSEGASSLPSPQGQNVEDRLQVEEKREKRKGPLSTPLPELPLGLSELERLINNMVSSASPLALAPLKLCVSPVTRTSLRHSKVSLMVSKQLSNAGDAIRRQSNMPLDIWNMHTKTQTWYAMYNEKIRAMEVLVDWIKQVSENLYAGTVPPYGVAQTWEQLFAVGKLLSSVTAKLDHLFDRLERRYEKSPSSSTSPLPRESTATNQAPPATLDRMEE